MPLRVQFPSLDVERARSADVGAGGCALLRTFWAWARPCQRLLSVLLGMAACVTGDDPTRLSGESGADERVASQPIPRPDAVHQTESTNSREGVDAAQSNPERAQRLATFTLPPDDCLRRCVEDEDCGPGL